MLWELLKCADIVLIKVVWTHSCVQLQNWYLALFRQGSSENDVKINNTQTSLAKPNPIALHTPSSMRYINSVIIMDILESVLNLRILNHLF